MLGRKTKTETDAEVVRLAKRFLSLYSCSHRLVKSFEEASSRNRALERISCKFRITHQIADADLEPLGNRNMREFVDIVAFGVERGADVEKAVRLFIRRLTHEIEVRNQIKAKAGGLQTLTYMGMGIFFPLFSGISAVIISDSIGLLDKGALPLCRGFLAAAVAYIPIILYLSSAFAHPEKSLTSNLSSILPYFLLASGIIYATQAYLSYVV